MDVNLAGNVMSGLVSSGGGGPRGIDNTGGHDELTVRNGILGGFGTAIETVGASRNRILDLDASAAGQAISISGGSDNEIRRSEAFGRGGGHRGPGLRSAGDRRHHRRRRLRERDHRFPAISRASSGTGRRTAADPAALTSGLVFSGSGARIAENHIDGKWIGGNIVVLGSDNVLVDNEASGGIAPLVPSTSDAQRRRLLHRRDPATGTVLRRNTATGNEGDGIEVRSPGVRLGDNGAFSNGDFGIDAVAGVIDLGGNRASGNGNALQCRNVFCP